MGERAQKEAWVTLATNDAYALGCLVLGNSLRRVQTTRQLVVMVSDGISEGMRRQLQNVFDSVVDVQVLDSEDARNLSLLGRPDLNVTYTKIHCWELVQYDKCVFLDADTLVIQNCDELFDREEFSAAPDAGWPDCFNSGVFVFCPSLETYQALLSFAGTKGSFDGGDQGLLNSFFNTWSTADIAKHLPFIYNVVSQAFYSYLPAFTQFRNSIKVVHFIGPIKPWNHPYNTATRSVTVFPETGHCQEFLQMWWDLFMEMVQPCLDPAVGGLVGELAQLKVGGGGGCGEGADFMVLDDRERRLAWERGHADYMGMDSFDNIRKKLDQKMGPTPAAAGKRAEGGKAEEEQEQPSQPKPAEVNAVMSGGGGGGVVSSSVVSVPTPLLPSPPVPTPVAQHVPVVSASISLGGVAGREPAEEVTETVTLGSPSLATFAAPTPAAVPTAAAAEATVSLPSPPAPVAPVAEPGPAPQQSSASFTMPLLPQGPAPAAQQPAVGLAGKPAPPVPEKKKTAAAVGKPQDKLAPLQIGKKPPPPPPEKPAGVTSPKAATPAAAPPVSQKPTSPTSPGKAPPPPLVPTKPASPGVMAAAAQQRSMFEKPGPEPAKPAAPRAGGAVSAFAARFQSPPAQTPASKPAPGPGPKPTSPTSPGVGPKPTSPGVAAPKPTSPTSPGVGAPKPTLPSSSGSAASPTSPSGQVSKNAEFLARFGLKKK